MRVVRPASSVKVASTSQRAHHRGGGACVVEGIPCGFQEIRHSGRNPTPRKYRHCGTISLNTESMARLRRRPMRRETPMPYIFAYFRHVYNSVVEVTPEGIVLVPNNTEVVQQESLHLAWSEDRAALDTAERQRRAVLPELWLRDPFIGRGPDGTFHLVATGGGQKYTLRYASSRNLLDWSDVRSLPVMADVPKTASVWAPEWIWDPAVGNYFVYWSSSHGNEGWDDSRIWCARTTDFQTFTAPQVLLDAGYTTIDATIIPHHGSLVHVRQRRAFRVSTRRAPLCESRDSPRPLDGPYTPLLPRRSRRSARKAPPC